MPFAPMAMRVLEAKRPIWHSSGLAVLARSWPDVGNLVPISRTTKLVLSEQTI